LTEILPLGKLDPRVLEEMVVSRLPRRDGRLVVGPSIGEDAAVLDLGGLGDAYMVVSSDPISGASAGIGRYAVHVNANDVSTLGARPSLFLCNILLRRNASKGHLDRVTSEISRECRKLGISIVGGHTEVAPIRRDIISSTMIGFVGREFLARREIRPGDRVLLTKGAGVEGTSIIAAERKEELSGPLGESLLRSAKAFQDRISVVKEAMISSSHGVRRMHDPTEGGVVGGLLEMSVATSSTLRVEVDSIPVAEETRAICAQLGLDPLRLIGSGSLLCIFDRKITDAVLADLQARGIRAAVIGSVEKTEEAGLTLVRGKTEESVEDFPADELWRVVG
jgi:hydrogenase expression/formation protein HypE